MFQDEIPGQQSLMDRGWPFPGEIGETPMGAEVGDGYPVQILVPEVETDGVITPHCNPPELASSVEPNQDAFPGVCPAVFIARAEHRL